MLFLKVTIKAIKQTFRRKERVLMVFMSPIVFFAFFGFIFGSGNNGDITYQIAYINNDLGSSLDYTDFIPAELNYNSNNLGDLYLDTLANNTSLISNSGTTLELIQYSNVEEMTKDIEKQVVLIGIIIPYSFTESLLASYNYIQNNSLAEFPVNVTSVVKIFGDPSSSNYQSGVALIHSSLNDYSNLILQTELEGGNITTNQFEVNLEELSQFAYFVPGFLIFLVILQLVSMSGILVYEKESGSMERIKLSLIKSEELFGGLLLSNIIIATIQFILSLVVITIFGFHASGSQWFIGYVIYLIATINISGIAMIIASFTNTTQDASSVSGIMSAPFGFLSGAFLPVPAVWLIKNSLQIWDIIPTYHATQAMTSVLIDNASMVDILKPLSFLLIFAFLWYGIGFIIFRKNSNY
ncbi:MAG: ABC transporter permease [Candidatus Heimdallarchaeota archaeon]|nr:ABC transporter permease [Candidatus Heimdallarchaeota archaeon]